MVEPSIVYNMTKLKYLPTFSTAFRLLYTHVNARFKRKRRHLECTVTDDPQPVKSNARKYTAKKKYYQQIPQRILLRCLQLQTPHQRQNNKTKTNAKPSRASHECYDDFTL